MKAVSHQIFTLSWVSVKDIVLDTGQGLHSTSGESLMAHYCEGWAQKSGAQNSALNFLRPQNHTTFLAGGFGGGGSHKSTAFFAQLLSWWCHMTFTGLRLVPGTDNNAPHWTSHTDNTPCFARFQGWLPERMSDILGILGEPLQPGTDPIKVWI